MTNRKTEVPSILPLNPPGRLGFTALGSEAGRAAYYALNSATITLSLYNSPFNYYNCACMFASTSDKSAYSVILVYMESKRWGVLCYKRYQGNKNVHQGYSNTQRARANIKLPKPIVRFIELSMCIYSPYAQLYQGSDQKYPHCSAVPLGI